MLKKVCLLEGKTEAEEAKRIADMNALMAANRIMSFNCGKRRDDKFPEIREANPLQKQLLDKWEDQNIKVFTYTGGNRMGKCQTYQTLIDTVDGKISIGELYERGKPFNVWAWDEKLHQKVVGRASAPFKKEGLHQCYRITMSDGQWVEAADYHWILTTKGYVSVDTLYAAFLSSGLGSSLCSDDSCITPLLCSGNRVVSITPITTHQEVYDFEVEEYHNYCAGGLIHHNTTIGAILAIATAAGEWPWSGKKMEFSHTKPRKVRYVGQGWEQHVKAVVEPALAFWWPDSYKVVTKKNNQGIDALWQCWSRDSRIGLLGTIEIMSNVQDSAVFEGWEGDLIIYDEPPRREVRVACARGLVDRRGRELFCMTLLGEAWVHREVIKAKLHDGTPDMTVFNVNGESAVNIGYGITQEGLDQFAKTLTDAEKEARLSGKPSFMSTLVCPRFDRQLHVRARMTVPLDALVDISIDWHPSKPLAVVFMATFKNGMKYIVDEIKYRGNSKSAAEEIVRVIRQRDYARINRIVIDPLSKSGMPNETDAFSIFQETLGAYGYCLEVASKEKDNGIAILNGLLWTENESPALLFFQDCGFVIQEVEDLMYDKDTFKPQKVNDDYFECLYRLCLMDTVWYPVYEQGRMAGKVVML